MEAFSGVKWIDQLVERLGLLPSLWPIVRRPTVLLSSVLLLLYLLFPSVIFRRDGWWLWPLLCWSCGKTWCSCGCLVCTSNAWFCSIRALFCWVSCSIAAESVCSCHSTVVGGISNFLVNWCHRSSLDHMTFCLRDKAMIDYSYFPQTVPIDNAEKITSEPHDPQVLLTRTCTIQKLKTLRGVPVWYRPNTLQRSS